MKKFYLIILFFSFISLANAQVPRVVESNPLLNAAPAKAIKFYPNPATSFINFELIKSNQKGATLQVYNFVGKKVYELSNLNQKTSLSLTEFYRGVYIFQLRDKSGRIVESGKFQVVK